LKFHWQPSSAVLNFHAETISVRKNTIWRKLVVGPVIVTIIETKKFNAIPGAVHYCHVPLVLRQRKRSAHRDAISNHFVI
jgi:hypothetical protein